MPLSAAALTCPGSPSFPCLDATPHTRRRGRRRDPSPAMAAPRLHLATAQSPSLTARPCQARRRRREKQEEEKEALPCGPGSPVKRRRKGRRNGPPVPRRPKNRPRREEEEKWRWAACALSAQPAEPSTRAGSSVLSRTEPACEPFPEPAHLLELSRVGPPSRPNCV